MLLATLFIAVPGARISNARCVCVIFALSAFILTGILYSPRVFSARSKAEPQKEWAVCMPFAKVANKKRQIKEDTLEREFAKFTPLEKKEISKERAAYVHMSNSVLFYRSEIEPWQWNNNRKVIDSIFNGEIIAKEFMIDVNNDGSLEHVVEFKAPPPYTRAWNYILDEKGDFNSYFFSSSDRPMVIIGQFRRFNQQTYIFYITNPPRNAQPGTLREISFSIYRPGKSTRVGVSIGWPACAFKVINR